MAAAYVERHVNVSFEKLVLSLNYRSGGWKRLGRREVGQNTMSSRTRVNWIVPLPGGEFTSW